MKLISTRAKSGEAGRPATFKEAVFKGLAPDGGLYHFLDTFKLDAMASTKNQTGNFNDMAYEAALELLRDELSPDAVRRVVDRAFTFEPVLKNLDKGHSLLELFHGPSFAFKDFGACFLASVMEEFLQEETGHAVILTATSGDTGSAVARAFYGKRNIDVVILYPSGRVSPLQEKQLTTVGGNVATLEVKGSFDDCQRMVKEAFMDKVLSDSLRLTSANSINLGRLIPQSFYYMYAFRKLQGKGRNVRFCVPSGNFGNLTAGVLAWSWGLPVAGFIAATNINDVVPEYLKTGEFRPRPSVRTLSNAMDVGNPSNFERLTAIFGGDRERMSRLIREEVVTDEETMETIARYHRERGLFLDPHTAVGCLATERFIAERGNDGAEQKDLEVVTLSTAHPGKFMEVVEEATGVTIDLPPKLGEVLALPKQAVLVDNTFAGLKKFLRTRFG